MKPPKKRPSRKGVKIASHKGRRTQQVPMALTIEEKQRLFRRKGSLSVADFVMGCVAEKEREEALQEKAP